ncbi:hypothetical protein BT93_A1088 [Corymbia citriodora subsp. variegata]|nr:hypothetical protein BT93_A1088 [Corymbia citriodora subsp. variegata]
MDVELSIQEDDVGTNYSIAEEVKKDEMDSLKEEKIWRSRRERMNNALAIARTAAGQDPAETDAATGRLTGVIKRGDVEEFISVIERLADQTDLFAVLNSRGPWNSSLLHCAASAGKDDILRLLNDYVGGHLIAAQDDWGNTPLHFIAKCGGSTRAAEMLIRRARDLPNVEDKNLLRMKNKSGDTALHEAVQWGNFNMVCYLLREDLEPMYWKNMDQKSPLYLALDTDNTKIVQVLFSLSLEPSKIEGLPPVQGAIVRHDYDLLGKILKKNMKLFAMTDSKGGNVLHLVAFLNRAPVFDLLQPEFEYLAREHDENGNLPIHIASKMGHVALIEKLHPVSQSVNGQGQTILHVATKYGRASAVRYILRHPDLGMLINERDHAGNTPSHLAAMYLQPAALIHLLLDERINPSLLNHECLTALDIARDHLKPCKSFPLNECSRICFCYRFANNLFFLSFSYFFRSQALTFRLLRGASPICSDLIILKPEARDKAFPMSGTNPNLPNPDRLRNIINTLLLVATLVTTVTFTAGFAVPGGFNGSDMASKDYRGMATMLDNRMFQAFVICNTIAMFCSMTSVVLFMLAYLSDVLLAVCALQRALALLAIALPTMSVAFLIGVTLTIGKLPWLATAILILGSIFILIITSALLSPWVLFLSSSFPSLWNRLRPIRPLITWFILAYIKFFEVERFILDDSKEDRSASKTSAN